ncbi:hypothetical protein ACRARG_04495 [Pseudooceanicola sp. C21-150M6]|uniref:hypothetical protein n=1 Tax=Pseudooceanicola sp. C21-150M6 TaxID=3434355 RepID=UPI003D7F4CCE
MTITVGELTIPTTGTDPKIATRGGTENAIEDLLQSVVDQLGTAAEVDTGDLPISTAQQAALDLKADADKVPGLIDTDAYGSVWVDANGYATRVDLLDGTTRSAGSWSETDAYDRVTVDAAGYAISGFHTDGAEIGATADSDLDRARLTGGTAFLILYGQSVLRGFSTTPISTTPVPNLKMFECGTVPSSTAWADPETYMDEMVDHVTIGTAEEASRGVAESFLSAFADEAGFAFSAAYDQVVSINCCESGRRADELGQNGAYWYRITTAIDAIAAYADAQGITVGILPLVYTQGEADNTENPEIWLRRIEDDIRRPAEAYAQAALGYPVTLVMVMTQVASHQYYGNSYPTLAEAVLDRCISDPNYVFGGTMYQYEYGDGGGVGSHLATAQEVKWCGAMIGRAVARVSLGMDGEYIRPIRAWVQGARTIQIEYDVPVEPLVIDTTNVAALAARGYQVYRRDSNLALTIASVAVVARRFVQITMSADLPATDIQVRYAWQGGATGVNAGRTTGSRGNMRDSDAATFGISGDDYALWHWAPIHHFDIDA